MLKDFTRRLFFQGSMAYFLLSFLSACAQIILRTALFVVDDRGARRNGAGLNVYQNPFPVNATKSLYWLQLDGTLKSCPDVPGHCDSFPLSQFENNPPLDQQLCYKIAAFSADNFRRNRLEDVVFIALHVYLVLVTIYAIARESIPHIISTFVTRCLSTAWACARVVEAISMQNRLTQLVVKAKCGSALAFFGESFFFYRNLYQAILLSVSLVTLILETFLAKKIARIYSERPWRVVQVSNEMRRMYQLILGLSVVLQMAGLVIPATMGMWIDQLLNTYFKEIVGSHKYLYGSSAFFLTFFLPLWVTMGWFSSRREWKRMTLFVLGAGVVILCVMVACLGSAMFIWTITVWWFFGTFYACSLALIIAILVLVVLCRRNFNKNLDHYLLVQSRLSATNFAHAHFEKDDALDNPRTSEDMESTLEFEKEYQNDDKGPFPK